MTTTNKFWRRFLRVLAGLALLIEFVFSIAVPKINGEPIYLDGNDGWVIGGAIALLLSIEGVKAAIDKWVTIKTGK